MQRPLLHLVLVAALALCGPAEMAWSAQQPTTKVRGIVADNSAAVLPGVVVNATLADGTLAATTTTDAAGNYQFEGLPAARVTLVYELEGFSPVSIPITLEPGTEQTLNPRLLLAPRSETVEVVAKAPELPKRPALPPPPPPPVIQPVVEHDRDSVCGPAKPDPKAESFGTIRYRRDESGASLYSKGDVLVISGGKNRGLEVGTNYSVRRTYKTDGARRDTLEHTAGVLQIVEVGDRDSLAVVVYACDAFMQDDRLAAFTPEPIRTPEPLGIPAFDNAARILFADVGQLLGASRRLMVIDRGTNSDLRVGQSLTLFRQRERREPQVIGIAVIVAIRFESATIRIDRATDEISFGDWAAPQRYPPTLTAQKN